MVFQCKSEIKNSSHGFVARLDGQPNSTTSGRLSASVVFTSANPRRTQLASGCPTSCSLEIYELQSVDVPPAVAATSVSCAEVRLLRRKQRKSTSRRIPDERLVLRCFFGALRVTLREITGVSPVVRLSRSLSERDRGQSGVSLVFSRRFLWPQQSRQMASGEFLAVFDQAIWTVCTNDPI